MTQRQISKVDETPQRLDFSTTTGLSKLKENLGLLKIGRFLDREGELEIKSEDFTTKKIQILAKTDSGKTYTASKICEEALRENVPICVVDPVSAYWGLQEKFDIVIFGDPRNKHANYHLHDDKKTIDTQAEMVADYLATNRESAIVDLKYWVENKQQQFMAAFAARIYGKNQIPRHIFIEEADIFAPQTVTYPDEINSRHYTDNLVRRGRQEGLGVTVISQRPALISKNILTQSDLSIYLNLSGAADLAPARKEIEDDADLTKEQKQQIISRIKKLPRGEGFFYSPRWLQIREFLRIDRKETYHAGATRGSPDWRPESDIVLKPIGIDDLSAKLSQFAVSKPETKAKADQLTETRIAEITKNVKDELEARHQKEIDQLNASWEKRVEQEREKNVRFEQLKKLWTDVSRARPPVMHHESQTEDMEVSNAQKQIAVLDRREPLKFEADSIGGRICLLAADGFFRKARSSYEVHKKYQLDWKLAKDKMIGASGSNAAKWRSRELEPALDMLCERRFQVLKHDGAVYIEGDNKVRKV